MSASSGETMIDGPAPLARSSAVAAKYTADLPHPVRCTTSARTRSATSARIAVHWSSRSRASSPASTRRHASASARIESGSASAVIALLVSGLADSRPASGPARRRQACRSAPAPVRQIAASITVAVMTEVAVVTGTSTGMGLHAAVELARKGLTVVATMRDTSRAGGVLEAARAVGADLDIRALDVTDHPAAQAVLAGIAADHGRIDVLVNNAGRGSVGSARSE